MIRTWLFDLWIGLSHPSTCGAVCYFVLLSIGMSVVARKVSDRLLRKREDWTGENGMRRMR